MPRLRPALALLSLALVVPFAACGDGNDPTSSGHTEAVYITPGAPHNTPHGGGHEEKSDSDHEVELGSGLRYQVQISRKINPYDIEDRDYLIGIDDAAKQVANPVETWFGVFIRVENVTKKGERKEQTLRSADRFRIEDNEGNKAEPTPLPAENVFAYRPQLVPPGGQLPLASSTAAQAPIGGALLLFKVDQGILERRPTKLVIETPEGEAEVSLDI